MSFYIGPFLIFQDKLVERDLAIRVCSKNPDHSVRQGTSNDKFCSQCGGEILDTVKKIQVSTSQINGNCPSDLTADELVVFHRVEGRLYIAPNMAFDCLRHSFEELGNVVFLETLIEKNSRESILAMKKRFEQSISKLEAVFGGYAVECGILLYNEY